MDSAGVDVRAVCPDSPGKVWPAPVEFDGVNPLNKNDVFSRAPRFTANGIRDPEHIRRYICDGYLEATLSVEWISRID